MPSRKNIMRYSNACNDMKRRDRKSTRLNSSHTVIYTLSLHDALPICLSVYDWLERGRMTYADAEQKKYHAIFQCLQRYEEKRSEEHTSELQSHRDLHSFPTRRSSDLFICL